MELEQKVLNQMNDIRIEDNDYEMVENDDDVVLLGDESACEFIWWVSVEQDSSKKIVSLMAINLVWKLLNVLLPWLKFYILKSG